MKEIVKLVTEWDTFESDHDGATIEDFCRYYLIRKKEGERKEALFGGHMPPEINSSLSKLLGRISAINMYYFKTAVKNEKHIDIESFVLVNSIFFKKEARKTEVINDVFMEPSTGIDILNRLRKNGFLTERDDPNDKRAKLVKLTAKGEGLLHKCWEQLGKVAFFMYQDMNDDEKKIVFQLLCHIDLKHTKVIAESKGKELDEMIKEYSDPKKYEAYTRFFQELRKRHKK